MSKTTKQALQIAIDCMNDRLEDHDCKYQRHPATEAERINILADIETVKEALAKQEQFDLNEDLKAWQKDGSLIPVKQEQGEPVAKMTAHRAAYFMERFKREEKLLGPNEKAAVDFVISMLEAQPKREPLWIDPNDKTKAQFLPHIGEPVLFCHGGKTYYGHHNGGSFQYGYGVTKRHYNTWECRWMYLPAAHGIKETS